MVLQMTYHQYGVEMPHVILCVHGLSRNSSDFHFLALELEKKGYHVVSVDVVGRGQSDWVPVHLYSYKQYVSDLYQLLVSLRISTFDVIGSSMGGILGLMLATLLNNQNSNPTNSLSQTEKNEHNFSLRKLILNDVGAKISATALLAIANLHLERVEYGSLGEIQTEFHKRAAEYGPISAHQWEFMENYSYIHNVTQSGSLKENHYYFVYDPNILGVKPADQPPSSSAQPAPPTPVPVADFELWNLWDVLELPSPSCRTVKGQGGVLVLHGKKSVILTEEIAKEMEKRKKSSLNYKYICFEECGHIPSLMVDPHFQVILDFLNE